MKAFEAARAGIQLVPEDRRIIQGLTVEENLVLAQIAPGHGWTLDRIYAHFPRLAERRKQEGVDAVGRRAADAGDRARAGARHQAAAARRALRGAGAGDRRRRSRRSSHEIKALGITTIIVEQNAIAALRLADRAVILDTGQVVFTGTARELLDNPQLRNEYLAI